MAILDSVRNIASANINRQVTNSISSGFTKVAGNLMGLDTTASRSASPVFKRKDLGKYKTENLEYPIGVEGDPQQGHYIIFEIMKQDKGKLEKRKGEMTKARKRQQELGLQIQGIKRDLSNIDFDTTNTEIASNEIRLQAAQAQYKNLTKQTSSSIQMSKNATTAMPVCIALYMPPSVSVSYGANYNDTEIGILAETGADIIAAFMNSSGGNTETAIRDSVKRAGAGLKDGLNRMGIAALDTAAPGASALIAIERGKIITPRMELMFAGIGRREFSYEFTFIPKSKQESDRVEKIIDKFKFHMHADFVDGNVREMEIPDFFNIRYMYKGKENSHLNKISTCVLKKLDVNYGSDRYVSYEDGTPQTTKISLGFEELEIITRNKIKDGF